MKNNRSPADQDTEVSEEEIVAFALSMCGPVKPHNPMLLDLDPWDEKLTALQQKAVLIESSVNPMYFYQMVMQRSIKAQQESKFNKRKEK